MEKIYRVGEITRYIRDMFNNETTLKNVTLSGEVSTVHVAPSGHMYFTLKDNTAQISGVMWKDYVAIAGNIVPKQGDRVLVTGRIGVYPLRGTYQIYAEKIRADGKGDLHARFEELKQKLDEEGLFEEYNKQSLPHSPQRIGVVTSSGAAALRDVLNVLERRYPFAEVIISHTLVQGKEAPPQIIRAMHRLEERGDVDVVLLVRGGGSIEDLWAFNDEQLVRAIYAYTLPLVSGVGHEIDFTLADFVADERAPTPSAAAEIATPDITTFYDDLQDARKSLSQTMQQIIKSRSDAVATQQRTLGYFSPRNMVIQQRQLLDEKQAQLTRNMQRYMENKADQLAARQEALYLASPQSTLERGYAIVTRQDDGKLVSRTTDVAQDTAITITLSDGKRHAIIKENDA